MQHSSKKLQAGGGSGVQLWMAKGKESYVIYAALFHLVKLSWDVKGSWIFTVELSARLLLG